MLDFFFQLVTTFGDGVYGALGGLFGFFVGVIGDVIHTVIAGLPDDPFRFPEVVAGWRQGMAWLNWFVPIPEMAATVGLWCTATIAFYVARFVLKMIGTKAGVS